MGYGRAAEALLLGDPFMAEAALEMGLVSRIVPPAEVSALAQRQAQKLAAKPMSSLLQTKRLMKKGQADFVASHMLEEATIFGRMLSEPAAREAFSAFLDKRHPDFAKL
jgi:enoyl-CoA hydratase/carnithine racemase